MTRPVVVPSERNEQFGSLLSGLASALDGSGPALALGFAGSGQPSGPERGSRPLPESVRTSVPASVPAPVALVLATSGSTGSPRQVLLDAAALRASAHATEARLGGAGQWLLTLPPTHVAGIQVLVRSLIAGTTPVVAHPGPFHAEAFTADVGRLGAGSRRYVSLVPTQLHRLLTAPGTAGAYARDALRTFDAVLVGGAALAPALAELARSEQVAVTTTYGMTETCGGCVYDSIPLDGARVRAADDGRLLITGPMLMRGYLGDAQATAATLIELDGETWLRTNDLGTVTEHASEAGRQARVHLRGRADDVVITGGVNVPTAPVEAALAGWNGIGEACVLGLPDDEWGQIVVAAITLTTGSGAPALADVRARVTEIVGAQAAPRKIYTFDQFPTRGPGKYDRTALRRFVENNRGV